MLNVVVLMSTYNGEKYIARQIESIINQDFEGHIHVLIRDDGSADNTVDILSDYKKNIENDPKRSVEIHKGKNVGAARSFMRLVNKCRIYDYYFFSDQDDIWDQNKISEAVRQMSSFDKPLLYSSGYRVIDKDGVITNEKFQHEQDWSKPLRTLYYSESLGCTFALNRKMMNIVKGYRFDRCMMHDNLIMFIASLKGTLIYDKESRISYRIHGENVMGLTSRNKSISKWIDEKLHIFLKGEDFDFSEIAERILKSGVDNKYAEDVRLIADCKKSLMAKCKLITHKDMWPKKSLRWKASVIMHIIFNLY